MNTEIAYIFPKRDHWNRTIAENELRLAYLIAKYTKAGATVYVRRHGAGKRWYHVAGRARKIIDVRRLGYGSITKDQLGSGRGIAVRRT